VPRVELVLFDVVETLFSLEAVGRRLQDAGAGERALQLWFARFLRDGVSLAACGDFQPFRAVAASSLGGVLRASGIEPENAMVEEVLAAFAELEPYPDVRPALERLRDAGVRTMTLSNGGADSSARLLERAGLRQLVEAVISVDEVRLWKPRPEPYHHACHRAGVARERSALVAVHSWDVHGAARAGLLTGWCSRLEGHFPEVFRTPTVTGGSLLDVVAGLLAFGE
jgi:2-haloacid dehalogenase